MADTDNTRGPTPDETSTDEIPVMLVLEREVTWTVRSDSGSKVQVTVSGLTSDDGGSPRDMVEHWETLANMYRDTFSHGGRNTRFRWTRPDEELDDQ